MQGFDLPRGSSDRAMEVIGIPMKKPGFYVVELVSPRLGRALHGEEKPYYVSTSVLVTNLAVHLKHGREGSLVWVTSLDRAQTGRERARDGDGLHGPHVVRRHARTRTASPTRSTSCRARMRSSTAATTAAR